MVMFKIRVMFMGMIKLRIWVIAEDWVSNKSL